MKDTRDRGALLPEDEWMRLWQGNTAITPDPDRLARVIMSHVWRFDHKVFWRNFREYAAGIVLMVVFAGQVFLGRERRTGAIGFVCVAFVMGYLWWKHRRLQPLDPSADVAAYRTALLGRYDDQIRLLRTVPYWYLLPLFVPGVSVAVSTWQRSRWLALVPLVVTAVAYGFIGWLNVSVGVRFLRAARARVESMLPEE
jgi:hypothetical protein